MRAAGGADEKTAEELKKEAAEGPHEDMDNIIRARKAAATEAKRAQAEKEEEEDFDDLPF